ncbi:MAG: outer membrane beta-barrel protein [Legionellales bacterium]|nr:outer membrane beta-barrel protein [Legionellales bacterium]
MKNTEKRPYLACSLIGCLLSAPLATAGELGPLTPPARFRPVVTLTGGAAWINTTQSQTFSGTDGELFAYHRNNSNHTTGLVGAFLGIEHPLQNPNFLVQAGLEYTYFGGANVGGLNSVGIEPNTSTLYQYNYHIQTQQALVVAKLLTTMHDVFHPYVSVGLGGAFHQASSFATSSTETGSLNLTPNYENRSQSAFSYSVGLGLDTNISERVRLGFGYRFSGFGEASLGKGQIELNQYAFPVPFGLNTSPLYANQFIAQLSYLA